MTQTRLLAEVVPLRRRSRQPCPICGARPTRESAPFCSPRCADIDLGRWLKEGYRIETDEAPGELDPDAD